MANSRKVEGSIYKPAYDSTTPVPKKITGYKNIQDKLMRKPKIAGELAVYGHDNSEV